MVRLRVAVSGGNQTYIGIDPSQCGEYTFAYHFLDGLGDVSETISARVSVPCFQDEDDTNVGLIVAIVVVVFVVSDADS